MISKSYIVQKIFIFIFGFSLGGCAMFQPEPVPPITAQEYETRMGLLHLQPSLMDRGFFNFLAGPATPAERQAFADRLPSIDWYGGRVSRRAVEQMYPDYYRDFLNQNAVTLFVHVPQDPKLAAAIRGELLDRVPPHVVLTDGSYQSDILVTYTRLYQDIDVVDRDLRQKTRKYPGKYRDEKRKECNRLLQAHYTLVRKKLEARYAYRQSLSILGSLVSDDQLRDSLSQGFEMGTDLKAETPCGLKPTTVFPDDSTRRKFDGRAQRREARYRLEERIARELARRLDAANLPLRTQLP